MKPHCGVGTCSIDYSGSWLPYLFAQPTPRLSTSVATFENVAGSCRPASQHMFTGNRDVPAATSGTVNSAPTSEIGFQVQQGNLPVTITPIMRSLSDPSSSSSAVAARAQPVCGAPDCRLCSSSSVWVGVPKMSTTCRWVLHTRVEPPPTRRAGNQAQWPFFSEAVAHGHQHVPPGWSAQGALGTNNRMVQGPTQA